MFLNNWMGFFSTDVAMDLGTAKAYELASGVISASFAHEEERQGVDAFLEKRKPPRH